MKTFQSILITLVLFLSGGFHSFSQTQSGPEGSWYGVLNIQGMELKIAFHLSTDGNEYSATMDSPDQQAYGIPATSALYSNSIVKICIDGAMIEYSGVYTGDKLMGTFKQGRASFSLNLSRRSFEVQKRPQEPIKPYPYTSEEIYFANTQDSIVLAGTLSLPASGQIKAAVVMISGSGIQNRDSEIMGHKPFLVISDYLVRRGIAVLRFDDRGAGNSGGNPALSTTKDYARDVKAALNYLKGREELWGVKLGMIGHSEGGIIAPIVASEGDCAQFMVLLAAPAVCGSEIIIKQQRLIASASGVSGSELDSYEKISRELFDLTKNNIQSDNLLDIVSSFMKKNAPEESDSNIKAQARSIVNPWMLEFLFYDPLPALKKSVIPALALNGEMDLQVSPDNLNIISEAYGNKDSITIMKVDGVNHLFQSSATGLPSEYSKIEETFSEKVLKIIAEWIHAL
jgi:pimeloyl-ACP methyl ester carboxylesterase